MCSSLLSGHGTAAQLPIAPQDADYPKTYEYRTTAEEYAAALETAGVSAARPRSLTLLVNEENAFKRAVAESLCAQLTTAALTVTVRERRGRITLPLCRAATSTSISARCV